MAGPVSISVSKPVLAPQNKPILVFLPSWLPKLCSALRPPSPGCFVLITVIFQLCSFCVFPLVLRPSVPLTHCFLCSLSQTALVTSRLLISFVLYSVLWLCL